LGCYTTKSNTRLQRSTWSERRRLRWWRLTWRRKLTWRWRLTWSRRLLRSRKGRRPRATVKRRMHHRG
jgi:hypothetical protein